MEENFYAVIMAGGGGTRLWPLSRQANPKQMTRLFNDRTMFQVSVDRLEGLFPPERICVVTIEEQARKLRALCPEIPSDNFILEPEPKNTASVVGLAAVALQKRNPNAVMAILTADHYIGNVAQFHRLLRNAYQVAGQEFLVTLGIQPTFPSTGYGYIQIGGKVSEIDGISAHNVLKFLEKPNPDLAQQLYESGNFAWNSGMFVWKADQIIVELARQMPDLYAGLQLISRSWSTPERETIIRSVWSDLRPISIDYGVMEGAENVAVIPAKDLGWSDVGSWESLYEVLTPNEEGNIIHNAEHMGLDSYNLLVFGDDSKRLVVTIGVQDLVIVDTGDVLMICKRENSQRVRQIVQQLHESKSNLT
jgi:mannose-1-phosphate guanylyltransferase